MSQRGDRRPEPFQLRLYIQRVDIFICSQTVATEFLFTGTLLEDYPNESLLICGHYSQGEKERGEEELPTTDTVTVSRVHREPICLLHRSKIKGHY